MTASRLLVDVIGEWRGCDADHSTSSGTKTRRRHEPQELERSLSLARTIEAEIIPRLMLSHRASTAPGFQSSTIAHQPTTEDVKELTRLVLEHDTNVARAYAFALREQGMSVEKLFTELIAPSARLLGEMWSMDACDFADVTIGITRLHHLVHDLSQSFEDAFAPHSAGRRILLLAAPGEQHTLGLMIVEEYFRRSDWDCKTGLPKTAASTLKLVRQDHFDVIGFSAGCEKALASLPDIIRQTRKASKNPGVVILVGGAIFLDHPEYASLVGADATAADGREAMLQLRSLFDKRLATL